MKAGTAVRGIATSPITLLILVLALEAAIWFFGPLLAINDVRPLELVESRLLVIVSFAVPALFLITLLWRQRLGARSAAPREWKVSRVARPAAFVCLLGAGIVCYLNGYSIVILVLMLWFALLFIDTRRTWLPATLFLALATAAVPLAYLIWQHGRVSDRLIANTESKLEQFARLAQSVSAGRVGDSDFHAVLPALDTLHDLTDVLEHEDTEPADFIQVGLYQSDAVTAAARQTYRDALNRFLLPRLLYRLEQQMLANINSPEFLYEALKVYLMLGLEAPMELDLIRAWMNVDWSQLYADPKYDRGRVQLAAHLDALLSSPMQEISMNGPLVGQVRGVLLKIPQAQRVYKAILASPAAQAMPPFSLDAAGGPATARVLFRSSGRPLDEGIAGIYTATGFHQVFLPELLHIADSIRSEHWVLGESESQDATQSTRDQFTEDALALYYDDYVRHYEALLGDIDIVPMLSVPHAVEVGEIISGPVSPIANILTAVAEETRLTGTPESAGADPQQTLRLSAATQKIEQILARAGATRLLDAGGSFNPGEPVEAHFAWLHDLVGGEPSRLDAVIEAIADVHLELRSITLSGQAPVAAELASAERLLAGSSGEARPLRRWIEQIAVSSTDAVGTGVRSGLNAAWQERVYDACVRILTGRYPAVRSSPVDIPLADFTRLLGPGQLIDGFFSENLSAYVDTASRPWRWNQDGVDLGISDAVLAQFEHAAQIRDAFFPGTGVPSMPFTVQPLALSAQALGVDLEVEGQTLVYRHGPSIRKAIHWPGEAGEGSRVTLSPEQAETENTLERDGPWSWFRLLDAAEIWRTRDPERSRVVFNVGGRTAEFELVAASALNPLNLRALTDFRCPNLL